MFYIYFLLHLVFGSCLAYVAYYYLTSYFSASPSRPLVMPYLAPEIAPGPIDNYTKGLAFEKFVVSRFSKDFFDIIDWRGDKSHQGFYPQSNCFPDLVMHYTPKHIDFAVECKWRQNFYDHFDQKIQDQIETYKKFSAERQLKVFLVIGIGGSPHAPTHLYIVPLREVSDNCRLFNDSFLDRFKKHSDYFFLRPKTIQLI
jgi:hypothetical protein